MDQNPPPDEPDRDEPRSQPGAPPPGTPGGGWQPPAPPGPPPPPSPPPAQPAPPGGWQPQSPAPQAPPPQAPAGYPPPPPPSYPTSGYPQTQKYPEGTYEGHTLASWGGRAGAALLDGLITMIPIWVGIGLVLGGADVIGVILVLLGLTASFLYAPFFMQREGERNGQTLGKQVVGIRVVRENKEPFTFGQAMLREFVIKGLLIGMVGSFFLYLGPLVNYLWPLWDEQNRAGHDFIASTRVVAA